MTVDKYNSAVQNVGIVALECYYPKLYISQTELEKHDNVSEGKYTIGLGQSKLAFVTDREDVCSMALTVMDRLTKNYKIDYRKIGRLEVATETIQDHSKSVKTFLMKLFEESDNFNVEGIDSMNACYAATNAVFNSIAWVESSDWNGNLAVVVAVDIAEYEKGPARPTGGCGAVAIVIGPDSPISFENKCRFSHIEHAFDFYKPHLNSPYPVVDGKYSNLCFLKAIDRCYNGYVNRYKSNYGKEISLIRGGIDHFVFHTPYIKLVQKAFARILYNEFLRFPNDKFFDKNRESLSNFAKETSCDSIELMKELMEMSKDLYKEHVASSNDFSASLGNSYTASVYFSLISLLANSDFEKIVNKRIVVFSYGSGFAASMFSLMMNDNNESKPFAEAIMARSHSAKLGLLFRQQVDVQVYEDCMTAKEGLYTKRNFAPKGCLDNVAESAYYVVGKDSLGRKSYEQKKSGEQTLN